LNRRCRLIVETLRAAVKKAVEEGCEGFVILGDLFDTERPEPQVIAAVQDTLGSSMFNYFLVGNHDQISTAAGDHTLGPLREFGDVVEKPDAFVIAPDVGLLLVPFQPGAASDWLPDAIEKALGSNRTTWTPKRLILGLHLGLADDYTPAWLKDSMDAIHVRTLDTLCKKYEIEAVFSGNWHSFTTWDCDNSTLYQVGTLCPTGFDNPGLEGYGSLIIWDDEEGVRRVEIPGPRFLTFSSTQAFMKQALKRMPTCTFARITATPGEIGEAYTTLARAKEEGWIVDGCVEPDRTVEQAAARTAASAARSAETLEEALAQFIAEMPIPDGVSRERIVERARKYLVGGG
jgi:hypothetical protein